MEQCRSDRVALGLQYLVLALEHTVVHQMSLVNPELDYVLAAIAVAVLQVGFLPSADSEQNSDSLVLALAPAIDCEASRHLNRPALNYRASKHLRHPVGLHTALKYLSHHKWAVVAGIAQVALVVLVHLYRGVVDVLGIVGIDLAAALVGHKVVDEVEDAAHAELVAVVVVGTERGQEVVVAAAYSHAERTGSVAVVQTVAEDVEIPRATEHTVLAGEAPAVAASAELPDSLGHKNSGLQ